MMYIVFVRDEITKQFQFVPLGTEEEAEDLIKAINDGKISLVAKAVSGCLPFNF